MTTPARHRAGLLRLALVQGIAAPLIYLGVILVGGALRPGYSHLNQAVSALTEAGAPDRLALGLALVVMELCTIAFGFGYFTLVRRVDRRLAASALMMVAIGVVGLGFARFAMDPMGSPATFDGAVHLALVAVSALAAIAAVLLAGVGWRSVRGARGLARVSLILLAVMFVSGVASGLAGAGGWPGIGLWQRINTGAFGFWQIATAGFLLRRGAILPPPPNVG